MKSRYIPAAIFILLFIIAGFMYLQYVTTPKMPEGFIFGSGSIEGIEYQASTRIPGKVMTVKYREGDMVKKGEIVAVLESKQLEAAVKAAEANVALWKNKHSQAKLGYSGTSQNSASVIQQAKAAADATMYGAGQADAAYRQSIAAAAQARAQLKQAEVVFNKQKKDYERYKNMCDAGAVSKNEFEDVEVEYKAAREQYEVAKKQGGAVDIQSTPGSGTTVRLEIPSAPAAESAASHQGRSEEHTSELQSH